MIASAWQVSEGWRVLQCVLPGAVIVQMGRESLVGRFPQTVSREVERDSQVFVLLNCGFKPLFAVSGKLIVS